MKCPINFFIPEISILMYFGNQMINSCLVIWKITTIRKKNIYV